MPTDQPTQLDRVMFALIRSVAVCGTTFLDERIPRYAARVLELRRAGYNIETRPCTRPGHAHRTRQLEYVLIETPDRSTAGGPPSLRLVEPSPRAVPAELPEELDGQLGLGL